MPPGARTTARWTATLAVLTALIPAPLAGQMPSRAPSGEFQPPTPSDRHRQDSTLNNLVHAEGYATAELGSLGQVVRRGTSGPPVVLVAGLGAGWEVFRGLMDVHEGQYRFHAVSLAGYGGSSAPPMPPAGTSYAERTWLEGSERGLARLIEDEGLDRPIVVAFYTDAADAVVHLAARRPDLVGGVLILSASAVNPLPDGAPARGEVFDDFAERWFKTVTEIMWPSGMWTPDYYTTQADVAERVWWEVLEPPLPVLVRYLVESWAVDRVPVAASLTVPTIILSPGFDAAFMSSSQGEPVRSRFHQGWDAAAEGGALDHRIVDGARFLIWEDAPEAVTDALSELSSRRGG